MISPDQWALSICNDFSRTIDDVYICYCDLFYFTYASGQYMAVLKYVTVFYSSMTSPYDGLEVCVVSLWRHQSCVTAHV